MSIGSISTSYVPQRSQALQAKSQQVQHAQTRTTQLQSNGLPKSPLNPSSTSKAGRSMSGAVAKRLLNLHL